MSATTSNDGTATGAVDVETNLTALRADIAGLTDSVTRLALESPELARDSFEAWIRRQPIQAAVVSAGVGLVLSLILKR